MFIFNFAPILNHLDNLYSSLLVFYRPLALREWYTSQHYLANLINHLSELAR
jgi:hypothetical protein